MFLEFSYADEARAAKLGGFMAQHYGAHIKESQPIPETLHGNAEYNRGCRCVTCKRAHNAARRAWQRRKENGNVKPREECMDITREQIDAMLAGRNRKLVSLAIGQGKNYLTNSCRSGRIAVCAYKRLRDMCEQVVS